MKILQLIQKPQPRGAEIFAGQLSEKLIQLGHTSDIISLFESNDSINFRYSFRPLGANHKKRFWDTTGWRNLASIIEEDKPDIIQANAGDTLKYAVLSKMLHKWEQPIVFRNASTLSSYIANPFQKLFNSFLYSNASAIISVSSHSKADLLSLFPKLEFKTTTIPIGLEEKKTVTNPFPSKFASKINFVHVGGFTFEKNHASLINIFSEVLRRYSHINLWLIGDGPLRLSIENLVRDLKLENSVHFTGFVDNPLDFIASADALLLPSIIEGLPGVLLESMLYDTPVIAYNVGGISEIVKNGETGWLIEAKNDNAFKTAIENLISLDKNEIIDITNNARAMVEMKYMNLNLAAEFIKAYENLLIKK